MTMRQITEEDAVELSSKLAEVVERVVDSDYPDGPIDWTDFLCRVEELTGEDLGWDMLSPDVVAIQGYARAYQED